MHRLVATALLLAAGLAVTAAGHEQAPVFRSGVDLVTIDATVVDGEGRPIEGLGPADFVLKVDGQPRRIASVQYVSRTRATAGESPAPAGTSTSAAVSASSNESVADGRIVLIAVDQANIRRIEGRQALRAAERFIDTLGPSDRVAVHGVNYAGDIVFSRDRVQARRQLGSLTGEAVPALIQPTFNLGMTEALWIADGNKSRLEVAVRRECGTSLSNANNNPARAEGDENTTRNPCPTQLEQEARMTAQQVRTQASLSINALVDMFGRLSTIDGPKTVALLSEGLVAEPRLIDLTALGAAAQQARVNLYVLQMETPLFDIATQQPSPTMMEDWQLQADGLARLAGSAGGSLFRLAGSDPAPFARIMRELDGYYLLAFEATDTDRNGRPHQIDVSVTRRGATLRSRQAFRFESDSWARRLTEERMVGLLKSASIATELPLRAASYSFFDPATGKVRVEIAAETEQGDGQTSGVLFGYVLLDAKGVIAASQVLETSSRRFTAAAVVDPGVYTLKVAGLDRFGRTGSLPRAVLAGVSDSPLPTSELLIARPTPDPNAILDPIVDRTSDDRIVAYLELYPDAGHSLRLVDVTVTVRPAARRDAVLTMPAAVSSRNARHGTARVAIPIADLEPGRYVIRADILDNDKAVGFVERTITIER
ncbi:MAG TPA: VWA domain-containing protein [Vicinamibacterales bacterium]|nr:VWA domain-containing protein [Vicinamibacterales bacterium]